MAWYLKIVTGSGDHLLEFDDDKAAADAALTETMNYMAAAGPHSRPVKIADRLVVIDTQIASANVYEAI